jgi:hypothetical protein
MCSPLQPLLYIAFSGAKSFKKVLAELYYFGKTPKLIAPLPTAGSGRRAATHGGPGRQAGAGYGGSNLDVMLLLKHVFTASGAK